MFSNIFDLFNVHFRILNYINYSISLPKHFTKPSLPIDNNFAPYLSATAEPLRTSDFLKEFSPNDYPFSRVIAFLSLIIILTDPSVII
jgi:hypothetical protein